MTAEPTTQAPHAGQTDAVWYAAFGSNLLRARFLVYLTGGPVPHNADGRVQEGARDPSPPRATQPFELPHRLFFALSSRAWGGGGVAFLDPSPSPEATTLGRLWLVSRAQFEDVYRQENGRPEPVTIDHDALADRGHLDLLDTAYGRLLHLGPGPGGHPIVTFTCDGPERVLPSNGAHPSYLEVMRRGLVETWGLDHDAASAYLAERNPGSKPGGSGG